MKVYIERDLTISQSESSIYDYCLIFIKRKSKSAFYLFFFSFKNWNASVQFD